MKKALLLWTLLLGVMCATPAAAKDKKKQNAHDPYATAEFETAPAVNAADLAYRAIVFDDFTVPQEWEAKARKLVTETEEQAIRRLEGTHAFTTVAKNQAQPLEEPWLLVKCALMNYRIVSKKARFFGGMLAGTSYISYKVDVYDGKSGALEFQREISTENNAFAAAWSFGDSKLPAFLGNVLGDYLALRARTDKGESFLPLETAALETTKK